MPIDCSFERSDILDWDVISDGADGTTTVVVSGNVTVPTAENNSFNCSSVAPQLKLPTNNFFAIVGL